MLKDGWLCVLTIILWLLVVVTMTGGQVGPDETTMQFAMELLKSLLKETIGNVVISPVSVSTLLAILQQGAMGNTLTQLTQVLHTEPELTRDLYGKLSRNLKKSSNSSVIIEFATKVFVNADFNIRPSFKTIIMKDFLSDIETLDFSQYKLAAQMINSWVEEQTHNRINEIVKPDMLDGTIRMLLANAIFFKGIWASPFKIEDTEEIKFHPKPGETIFIPTMRRLSYMIAGEDPFLACRWVELPFSGDQFSMLVVLPHADTDVNTLAELMARSNGLKSIFKGRRKRNVNLSLPKFKLTSQMKLVSTLVQLGVYDVFSQRDSNLRGISDQELFVSQALHTSEISIDERGGTAASATAVVMKLRSAVAPPMDVMDVIVDRPFLMIIVDKYNKVPLFAGRVSDPSKS